MVADDWNQNQYKGIVEDSVVVFVVRKGNPDNIQTWDDLISGDVEVADAEPVHVRRRALEPDGRLRQPDADRGQVRGGGPAVPLRPARNVPVQDESARDALGTFLGGKGDVLLAYENEAIAAQDAGEDIDYVVPDSTILIETPIAVTDGRRRRGAGRSSTTCTPTRRSSSGPTRGYRPVVKSVLDQNKDKFPTPPDLFTIADLGGWDKVTTEFFDPENGSVAEIEKNLGVATE